MTSIQISSLTISTGIKPILDRFSMQVESGESIALVGSSGSGKTTIALSILGYLAPNLHLNSGDIRIGEVNPFKLRNTALRAFRKKIAYVDQDPGASLPPRRVIREIINERVKISANTNTASLTDHKLLTLLGSFGLDDISDILSRSPSELSGGQRRRVAVAAGVATNPDLLIIDEPTAGIDFNTAMHMIDSLRTVCAKTGSTTIVITHDPIVATSMSDRIVSLSDVGMDKTKPPLSKYAAPRGIGAPLVSMKNLGLVIHPGELIGLTGRSGSGKTTIIRAILGLNTRCPYPIELRTNSLGWAPQEAELALNPSVTIRRQLRRTKASLAQITSLISQLDLPDFFSTEHRSLRPDDLSGGQRQRVNVARALLMHPQLLLCDEPTSALDSDNAQLVMTAIRNQCLEGTGALIVSHHDDVLSTCDRVITLT